MIASLRYLVEHLWPILAAGLALGLVVGAATCGGASSRIVSRMALVMWAILVGAAVSASAAGLLPGRYGLWLEIGALLLSAYVFGCFGGCAIRAALRRNQAPTSIPTAPA